MDSSGFAKKWLNDLLVSQRADGLIATHIPSQGYEKFSKLEGSCGWGDSAVIVPYDYYEMYGDISILERHYSSMKLWLDYLTEKAKKTHWLRLFKKNPYKEHTLDTGFHFGEWNEPNTDMGKQQTKNMLFPDAEFATAYYAHSAHLVAKTAGLLNKNQEEIKYRKLYENIKKAYRYNFTKNGIIDKKRDCKYVRPVFFDLLSEEEKVSNMEILNRRIIDNDYKIGTGFLSTPFLLPVLCDYGYTQTAYKMLENEESPSWLYSITKGATTIWESWEGINKKGVPKDSLNHYSYGGVVAWFFKYCAGIKALSPGFERIEIKPLPGGSLTHIDCYFDSPSGKIEVHWRLKENVFDLKVSVPVSSTIILPDTSMHMVDAGTYNFNCTIK